MTLSKLGEPHKYLYSFCIILFSSNIIIFIEIIFCLSRYFIPSILVILEFDNYFVNSNLALITISINLVLLILLHLVVKVFQQRDVYIMRDYQGTLNEGAELLVNKIKSTSIHPKKDNSIYTVWFQGR